MLSEGVLARFLNRPLDGGIDLDVLAEVAAGPAARRRDRQDDQAVRPVVGVGGADPLGVLLARVAEDLAVEVGVGLGVESEDGELHVLAEAQVLQGGGGGVGLEDPDLVVDLHGGRVHLAEGPVGE